MTAPALGKLIGKLAPMVLTLAMAALVLGFATASFVA